MARLTTDEVENYIIKNDTLTLPSTAAFWPGKLDEKYMTVFDDIITKK